MDAVSPDVSMATSSGETTGTAMATFVSTCSGWGTICSGKKFEQTCRIFCQGLFQQIDSDLPIKLGSPKKLLIVQAERQTRGVH
jgi:hypothetical protein